ncbi:NAD(P)H-dependent oxidoreductase [bacterium]|nr:NAD(P)H-dependent oxidoreductase [bacterium]
MVKILILYHSQEGGSLEMMARAVAEGAEGCNAEVTLFNANRARLQIADYAQYDAVAIGSPDYFSYVAGTLKTFLDDWQVAKRKDPAGLTNKPVALFMAYERAGHARYALEMLFTKLGPQAGTIVESDGPPTKVALYACHALGQKLTRAVS